VGSGPAMRSRNWAVLSWSSDTQSFPSSCLAITVNCMLVVPS
jgi:hypothetical protein